MGSGYQTLQSRLVVQGAGLWGLAIVVLVLLFLYRLPHMAGQLRDRLGELLVVSVAAICAVQFGWNLFMTIGWLPTLGIPLPFVAHGSQQVLQMAVVGLALSAFRRKDMSRTLHIG